MVWYYVTTAIIFRCANAFISKNWKEKDMKKLLALILISAMALSITACSSGDEGADSGEDAKDILVVSQKADAVSLDPQVTNDQPSARVFRQIFDTLFLQGNDGSITPLLAESYEFVNDGMTLNIKLREGVMFHNGETLTANDVKFTFLRGIESPQMGNTLSFIDPEGITVVDDYNISINFLYAFAPSIDYLANPLTAIMNEKAVTEAGDAVGTNPVGTGPFKFVNWDTASEIVLEANYDYWDGAPGTDGIVFRIIPETETAMLELETGGVDIVYDIGAPNIERTTNNPDLKIARDLGFSVTYIGMNTNKKPFDDVRVRQALNYALDMETIVESVFHGAGSKSNGPISPMVAAYDDTLTGYEYNPEKAVQLLTEAGYADGFETTLWVNDGNQDRANIAVWVQSQLAEVGVTVSIEYVEWSRYLEDTALGLHDMYILGWSNATGTADQGLYTVLHSSAHGTPGNRAFYTNERFDELLDSARISTDPDEQMAMYAEAQQIAVEEAPWIFTWNQENLTGTRANIEGYVNHPSGRSILKDVTK